MKKVEVFQTSASRKLSETEVSYTHLGASVVLPYADSTVLKTYELLDGRHLSTQTTTVNAIDSYGNVTDATTEVVDHEPGGTSHKSQVLSSFTNNVTNWRVRQLDAVTTKFFLGGTHDVTKDKLSEYSYYPNGRLESIKQEAGKGVNVELTATVNYDNFGNVDIQTVAGPSIVSRTSTVEYDARGQFPVSIKNPLLHEVTRTWNADFGTLKTETDANNHTMEWVYNSFGQLLKEERPDSTISEVRRYEVVSQNPIASIGARWYVETTGSGVGPTRTFLDLFGRTVRGRSQGFDGTYVNVDTQYDARGRASKVSEPYFDNGSTPVWNETVYDHLNRPNGFIAADTTRNFLQGYNGFVNTRIDTGGRMRTSTFNAVGQLVETKDAANTIARFLYDAAGNRIEVIKDFGGTQENSVTYTYDQLGRQLTQDDPDHGIYGRIFDGLGQLRFEVAPEMWLTLDNVEYR